MSDLKTPNSFQQYELGSFDTQRLSQSLNSESSFENLEEKNPQNVELTQIQQLQKKNKKPQKPQADKPKKFYSKPEQRRQLIDSVMKLDPAWPLSQRFLKTFNPNSAFFTPQKEHRDAPILVTQQTRQAYTIEKGDLEKYEREKIQRLQQVKPKRILTGI